MPIQVDGRIRFQTPIHLAPGETGSLAIEVFGGPLARVQAAVFGADDKPLRGVGFDNFGPPLTTEMGGKATWLFIVDPGAAYLKWSVQAVRSAANLANYSATSKVRNSAGDLCVSGQFSGQIAEGKFADDIIPDGADFASAAMPALAPGAST